MSPSPAISGAGANWWAHPALVAEAPEADDGHRPRIRQPTVHVTDRRHFGATLLHATGSAEHFEQLRALAEEKGMELEADGLKEGWRLLAAKEEEIYSALGLPFIEPELREGRGELERALRGSSRN
jgi:DNA polymerase (family X)